MSKPSWGSLTPKKGAPEPEIEEVEELEEGDDEAAQEALFEAIDHLGERMASWAEMARQERPEPEPVEPAKDEVAEAVQQLSNHLTEVAAVSLETRVSADTAMEVEKLKASAAIAQKATGEITGAIDGMAEALKAASAEKPELADAFRVMGDLLGKKIEKVGTQLDKAAKNEGARSERNEKALIKAVTELTKNINEAVRGNAANSAAMSKMATAITTLETRLETLNKQPKAAPVEVRKPVPYRFTISRNPETELIESCVAEPLS